MAHLNAVVAPQFEHPTEGIPMTINILVLQPLVALVAGILILIAPRLLNYVVAIYLILVGVTGLWPHLLHLSVK